MKRIYQLLLVAVAVIGITTSCSDVPAPYEVNPGANGGGKTLPYKSTALSTGWTMHCISANEPWSQGSSYTQATGYQDWDGDGTKSNVEVESYLISPPFNTACESGKVRFYFDNTIRYTNNVSGWLNYEKIFVSSNYDGKNFDAASWQQIAWTPVASPFSDWTLYSSGQIQLPEAYVNQDSVYIAFYFYAPSNASTTWELENFMIEEGEADNSGSGGGDTKDPIAEGNGTKASPYNPVQADAITSTLPDNGKSDNVYVKGYVSQISSIDTGNFGNATYYISTDGTTNDQFYIYRGFYLDGAKFTSESQLQVGDTVVVYGQLQKYVSAYGTTNEMATGNKLVEINGKISGGDTPTPSTGFDQDFTSSQGAWKVEDVELGTLSYVWAQSSSYGMKASAYASSKNVPAESWLISPSVTIGDKTTLSFVDALNYLNKASLSDHISVRVSTNYTGGAPSSAAWTEVTMNTLPTGSSWDWVTTTCDLSKYAGQSINVAFRYVSTSSVAPTWEIKSVSLTSGGGGSDEPGGEETTGEGVSIKGTTVTLTNGEVSVGEKSVSVDLSTLGFENAESVEEITLSDGSTITFGQGSNSKNDPKYYTATKGVRVYANNTIEFAGQSPIAQVVMECDSYNGTDYVGNATATVSFSGNKATYVNASSDAGTQLRVKTITIKYAD